MAETRNYRIFYTVKLRHYEDQESVVEAYTAEDALTQFKILRGGEWFKVTKIEPAPPTFADKANDLGERPKAA